MRPTSWIPAFALVAPVLAFASCSSGSGEQIGTDSADQAALSSVQHHPHKDACASTHAQPGFARCHAKVRTDASGNVVANATPSGLGPSDLHSAYNLPSTGGSGITVAIVDAYDNPSAESDLATYRSTYGLPPCTTANGCFKKVNQSGQQGNYPASNSGWAGEIALDLDMVSAVCPSCKILLVEANSASMTDLGASVNTAVSLGAAAISNSYGGSEDASSSSDSSSYFNHPGVLITASSGDSGYGVQFPASSQYVLAVGGTTLARSSSTRGWAEGAWSSGGSGCSGYIAKPSWQHDNGCAKRMEADVSAVGDPNTGVAVYTGGAWNVYGGTSASSPIVAATYALLGLAAQGPSYAYAHTGAFYDVTTGSNGTCSPSYFCNAGAGYDGPTGLGTPNGAALASGGGGTPDAGSGTPDSGTTDSGGGTSSGITNGGFETGSLGGWTASGTTSVVSSGAHGGTYAAQVGGTAPTNGDSSIAQTFTAPSTGGTLSFWYQIHCPDTVQYDWATATLTDNTAATSTTMVANACSNTSTWQQASATLTAGHSYTLKLVSHDDNYAGDATYTLYDDVAIGASAPPPPPPPSGGLTNGGFESGSLSGWTPSGTTSVVSSGAHGGTYAAELGSASPTNGDSSIAQTFTAPSGTTKLTFWYGESCPDTVQYDWATATLKDNTAGTTSTVLAKVCAAASTWTQVTASVTAGHSYTLTLTSHDDNYAGDATHTLFDDVAVQ